MDWDELKPKPAKGITLGEDLRTLSVSELEARIVELSARDRARARARSRPRRRTRPRPPLSSSAEH